VTDRDKNARLHKSIADQIREPKDDLQLIVEYMGYATSHLPRVDTGMEQPFGDQLLEGPALSRDLLLHIMQDEQHDRSFTLEVQLCMYVDVVDRAIESVQSFTREAAYLTTRGPGYQLLLHPFEIRMLEELRHGLANHLFLTRGPRQAEHRGIEGNDAFAVVHHDAVG
jgi:hypothetical protein